MAQIKVNSAMWNTLLNTSTSIATPVLYVNSVFIMQGGMPMNNEAYGLTYDNFVGGGPYATNVLAAYSNINVSLALANSTATYAEVAATSATKAGLATWACVVVGSGGGATQQLFVGNVTDTYGTGFLRMNETTITVGERYKILGIQLSFANQYTF